MVTTLASKSLLVHVLVEGNTIRNNLNSGVRNLSRGGLTRITDNEIYLNGTGVEGGGYYNFGSIEGVWKRIYANLERASVW